MNGMTILMVLHNAAEYVKLSIQSIRMFADVENLSVVVVDNHSDDALAEWAREQEDITYVYMDEGELPFGQVVNKVCDALEIDSDLLVMDAHYMLTPHALGRMQALLYREPAIGAVGGMSNSFSAIQKLRGLTDYEEAVRWADIKKGIGQSKRILGLHSDIVLLKAEMLSETGVFDEELVSQEYVMKDLEFRMVLSDWELQICQEALFWDVRGNGPYLTESKTEEATIEKKWGMHYFNVAFNRNLLELINKDREAPISVLEIGCDCGATLLEIRNLYPHAAVYGVELNEKAAMVASHVVNVQVRNIEEQNLDFAPHTLDYIIFGDVLEHLHDPLKTLQYCREFLKEDGHILASIPNLMHISVMEELLKGNFTYMEKGLLDRTHIHFFTYNEIIKMFHAAGYEMEEVRSVLSLISEEQEILIDRLLELRGGTSRHMYETFQYVVCAGVGTSAPSISGQVFNSSYG